jgi:hypothetical protein
VTKGEVHGELAKRPWKRESSYRVPSMRMGRPDLPHAETEIEGLIRLIGTLPGRLPWWPGQSAPQMGKAEVAYEVRALLAPRIITVTLGKGDRWADYYLFGPGDADRRCAVLCLQHPDGDAWAVVGDRELLTEGEEARKDLTHSILRSAQEAIAELNRHWIHSPELLAGP